MDEDIKSAQFLPGFSSLNLFSDAFLRATVQMTRHSNELPTPGSNYDFYNGFEVFRKIMEVESRKLQKMMSSIITQQTSGVGKTCFISLDTKDQADYLTDMNGAILKRVRIQLDEAQGKKNESKNSVLNMVTASITRPQHSTTSNNQNRGTFQLLTASTVARPQLRFRDKIDNTNTPFVPIIKDKPNSLKPLAILVEEVDGQQCFSHPYEFEIEHFTPPEEQFVVTEQPLKSVPETPLVYVDTLDGLISICDVLKQQKEFAVDLEHHSFRSFQGFTCLIQISTREKDFIIDPFDIRHELWRLNDSFTDPKIVKVFHGAASDVIWLQRDFGVYIVNMFDTGIAAKLLNFERLSLSYLLKRFLNIELDKTYQLADWRIRPLTEEMMLYARMDTHYLLHVYDLCRGELSEAGNDANNLVRAAFERSNKLCLRRYEKPLLTADSFRGLLLRNQHRFTTASQIEALRMLFAWRDGIARIEDESTGYILPNHMLLQIAEILPKEMQGIIACCNPCPPLVRQQLNELHMIVRTARELHAKLPLKSGAHVVAAVQRFQSEIDLDSAICTLHDIPKDEDCTLSFSTLLDNNADDDILTAASSKPSSTLQKNASLPIFRYNQQKTELVNQKPYHWYLHQQKTNAASNQESTKEPQEKIEDSQRLKRLQDSIAEEEVPQPLKTKKRRLEESEEIEAEPIEVKERFDYESAAAQLNNQSKQPNKKRGFDLTTKIGHNFKAPKGGKKKTKSEKIMRFGPKSFSQR